MYQLNLTFYQVTSGIMSEVTVVCKKQSFSWVRAINDQYFGYVWPRTISAGGLWLPQTGNKKRLLLSGDASRHMILEEHSLQVQTYVMVIKQIRQCQNVGNLIPEQQRSLKISQVAIRFYNPLIWNFNKAIISKG